MGIDTIYIDHVESGYQKVRVRGMPAFVCFKGGGTPDASPEEIATREKASNDWNRYEEAFKPLEKDAIDALGRFDPSLRGKYVAGKGSADVEQQGGAAEKQIIDSLRTTGAALGSARGLDALYKTGADTADAQLEAKLAGHSAGQGSYDAERMGIINRGRDVASEVTANMAQSTNMATEGILNKLNNKMANRAAMYGAVGQIAGAGTAKGFDALRNKQPVYNTDFTVPSDVESTLSPTYDFDWSKTASPASNLRAAATNSFKWSPVR